MQKSVWQAQVELCVNAAEQHPKLPERRCRCADYSIRGEEKLKVSLIWCKNQEAESDQRSDHAVAVPEDGRGKFKKEKKSTVRTREKPDAILVRSKDQNATYASDLKLMKDRESEKLRLETYTY